MATHIRTHSVVRRYSLAVGATLIGIGIQIALIPFIGFVRFLIVWPVAFSVMAVAGFGPACVSILLSAMAAEIYFNPINSATGIVGIPEHIKMAIFVGTSLAVGWLLDRNQRDEKSNIEKLANLEERERRRIQGELDRSEAEMEAIFKNAPVGMVQVDFSSLCFLRVNAHLSHITGFSKEELLQFKSMDLTYHEDMEGDRLLFEDFLSGKSQVYENEKRFICKHGEPIWVRTNASIIRDALGSPTSIIGIVQDVDDQKKAEQRIQESEERYRQLTETLPQLVWTALPDGWFDYLSRQWLEYTGSPPDQQLGHKWLNFVHPEDKNQTAENWNGAVAGFHPLDLEFRLRRHDGVYRWFKLRGTPIYNTQGKIVYWFGTNTDVHEQKIAVNLIERANTELRFAKEQAEQANRLKSAFLANMSHEIRTPMTAVLGFAELLRDEELSTSDREDAIERIARGGHTLLKLIDDILDISKIEADKLQIERVKFDPAEVVKEVVSMLRIQSEAKGVSTQLIIEDKLPGEAVSDPARLRQILTNVIGNAIKFTSQGEVRVKVRMNDLHLLFEVEDTGIGIGESDHSKLFQPFAQSDVSITRNYGGSGLGLALSRRLCRELGGDLVLQRSVLGKGSLFVASIQSRALASAALPIS